MSLPSREGSDEVQDRGSRREDCRHADKRHRVLFFRRYGEDCVGLGRLTVLMGNLNHYYYEMFVSKRTSVVYTRTEVIVTYKSYN